MDVTRDRAMRRFDTALGNDLHAIDAKVKIFTKNHRFSKRSLRKDLHNMMISKRKCALSDLDVWEHKRQAKITERNEALLKKAKIISILEAMTPVKNHDKQYETTDLPDIGILPLLTTRSEDTNCSSKRRESIVLPAITARSLEPKHPWTKVSCKKVVESEKDEIPHPNPEVVSNEIPKIEAKPSLKKFSKWKVISKVIQNEEPEDTQIYDTAGALKLKIDNSNPERAPISDRRASMATTISSEDRNEHQIVNKWRRLSILSNGRRNSLRRSSVGLSATQAVKAFLEIMSNRNKPIEEEKNHDLSYLRNCRYLRHNYEDGELYE